MRLICRVDQTLKRCFTIQSPRKKGLEGWRANVCGYAWCLVFRTLFVVVEKGSV